MGLAQNKVKIGQETLRFSIFKNYFKLTRKLQFYFLSDKWIIQGP